MTGASPPWSTPILDDLGPVSDARAGTSEAADASSGSSFPG